MAGYKLQGKKQDGTTCDISLVATYDSNKNKLSEYYMGEAECENIKALLRTIDTDLNLFSLSLGLIPNTLEDCDWSTIKMLSDSGCAKFAFNIGDEKTIALSTGEEVTLQILGFNHDDLADGSGKAGITFGMKNLLAAAYPMNDSGTNVGGWDSSVMRTTTMATLLMQLPSDLQSAIKQVNKKASSGNKQTTITTSIDKLFLFSKIEVDGTTYSANADGDEPYEYWKSHNTNADRIKKLSNGTGSANGWWLRSPSLLDTQCFDMVSNDGRTNASGLASFSRGMCLGFCV